MSSPLATEKALDADVNAEMEIAPDEEVAQDDALQNGHDAAPTTVEHESPPPAEPHPASSTPHHNRKDATLREFLSKMDDYAPIIPDAVTAHYLTLSGLPPPSASDPTGVTTNTTPLPLARLLALATQKFIADIAADAYQYSRIRASNSATANPLGGAVAGQPGTAAAGGAAGKGAQATQLGVQRSGYGGGGQGGGGQGRTVLTMEDLGMAVAEYGVNVKRGEFYR